MSPSRVPFATGILSAGTVLVGIGFGAVAYFTSEGASARTRAAEDLLAFVPPSAGLIGQVDFRSLAESPLGREWSSSGKQSKPLALFEELRETTGIDLVEDVDSLTFSVRSEGPTKTAPGEERWGMAVSGSFEFDELVEKLAERESGVSKETHGGTALYRLSLSEPAGAGEKKAPRRTYALAHPDAATVLLGDAEYLKEMLDARSLGGEAAAKLLEKWGYGGLESELFWIAGSPPGFLDGMTGKGARLPAPLRSFAITGRLDSGVLLKARGRTADPGAAQKLADVVRGFVALGRLREGSSSQGEALARIAESVQVERSNEEIEVSLLVSYDDLRELVRAGGSDRAVQ